MKYFTEFTSLKICFKYSSSIVNCFSYFLNFILKEHQSPMNTSPQPPAPPPLSPVVASCIAAAHCQMEELALAQYVCKGQSHFSLLYSSRSFTYEYTHITTSQIKIQAISSTQKTPQTPPGQPQPPLQLTLILSLHQTFVWLFSKFVSYRILLCILFISGSSAPL